MAGVRAAAEVYYANNNAYGAATMATPANPCTAGMFIDSASGMNTYTGTAASWPSGTLLSCQATTAGYAVSASLSTSGQFWCVDSTGVSQSATAQQTSGDITC